MLEYAHPQETDSTMNNDIAMPHTAMIGSTLYKEVKRGILAALAGGEWKAGEAIPAERKLGERFGVSIGTLRKAIDELVAENILIRHQGRGTFVATHARDHHYFRFFRVVRQDGYKTYPTVALERFRKAKASREACEKLGLGTGARVFQFTNRLMLDDDIVMLDEITLPEALFAGLTEADLRDRPTTLYNLYQDVFGLNVIRTDERLRAGLAEGESASLLGVPSGTPVIELRRIAFSYHDQPVEWRISRLNTEKYEYLVSEAGA